MTRKTRPVSWVKTALKEFEAFPEGARTTGRGKDDMSDGAHHRRRRRQGRYRKADAGPRLRRLRDRTVFKGDAFRVVYAVQIAEEIWVVHAFQKKSTQGIRTPQREIDLIIDLIKERLKRLKRLKEMLR